LCWWARGSHRTACEPGNRGPRARSQTRRRLRPRCRTQTYRVGPRPTRQQPSVRPETCPVGARGRPPAIHLEDTSKRTKVMILHAKQCVRRNMRRTERTIPGADHDSSGWQCKQRRSYDRHGSALTCGLHIVVPDEGKFVKLKSFPFRANIKSLLSRPATAIYRRST